MCNSLVFVLPKNPKGFIIKFCFRNACTTDSQNYQRKSKWCHNIASAVFTSEHGASDTKFEVFSRERF